MGSTDKNECLLPPHTFIKINFRQVKMLIFLILDRRLCCIGALALSTTKLTEDEISKEQNTGKEPAIS